MSLQDSKAEFQKRLLSQPKIKKQVYSIEEDPKVSAQKKDFYRQIRKSSPAVSAPVSSSLSVYNSAQLTRYVYDVLQVLKKEERPLDRNEMIRKLAFDVFDNDDLMEILMRNEKISFDPSKMTFAYKPTFSIRSKEDLLRVLKENSQYGGIEMNELADSWSGVKEALLDLEKEGHAILLKTKDGNPRLAYFNDQNLNLTLEEEFKTMWKDILIPADMDLQKELEKAGLKTFGSSVLKTKKTNKTKGRSKRVNKRTKITNTHLEGIDLRAEILGRKVSS